MSHPVRLVIADVDGTLVTPDKVLTPRASQTVRNLRAAGIAFTITSGRPPAGMKMLIEALALKDPLAAFNGGLLVRPDLSVIREHLVPAGAARQVLQSLRQHRLDSWLYTDRDWYVQDRHGLHVDREEWTVKFPPVVAENFDGLLDRVVKIVGVGDDHALVARCEADIQAACGAQVSAARSQPYYLDITHPDANKGTVVDMMSQLLSIPADGIATIGDMPNDVLMFKRSGLSIAMGNASDDVKREARFVTASNTEDGFATAMERFVLPETSSRPSVPSSQLKRPA
jgi:Cof subfamily protein (haloacid dehalogenase superfamily)